MILILIQSVYPYRTHLNDFYSLSHIITLKMEIKQHTPLKIGLNDLVEDNIRLIYKLKDLGLSGVIKS